jgi:hypothetical protein
MELQILTLFNTPEWCNCGHCMAMPTQEENKCCARTRRPCVSRQALFNQIVLDANILDIAMRYREDVLVLNNNRNNENFRHAAYRQFVLCVVTKTWNDPQRPTMPHNDPTTTPLQSTMTPQPPTTTPLRPHYDPTTTHSYQKTSHNDP